MKENFVVKAKKDRSVTMTIRIESETNDNLEDLARKSNRSRNELINLALKYAFANVEFVEEKE
ncbi:MAG: ribbon-helix-helix domain-containing protein [Oscillospiraceae bacterium]|jgi:predicted transcriptional regulator|nr:ribbon-helix-helix domain-containing protein [Oscillospiraceae bacterium]